MSVEIFPLSEEDIPGALLRGRNPQQLTIPELRRWLSCRKGAKTNGKKRNLVERVESYIQGGLDKDIVDPDGRENIREMRKDRDYKIQVVLSPVVAFTDFDSSTPVENVGSPENMPTKLPRIDTTVKEIPLPSNVSEEAKHFIDSTVRVTLGKAFEIESSTRDQSSNGECFKLRQCRLTASNFGIVLKRKKKDCTKLVDRLTQ
ncbi:hypothetical protein AWC38_SpisGene14333 [Stylophora pistillata]|uniref:SAP domain-containing protein n=1 Tax=Stylophora pistillata TaxID=50429 RepID=A0A2B4RXZ7_STYPI|nr:hypothetical protein AWC38_SpisGene14333 [Stylophora pistillata]